MGVFFAKQVVIVSHWGSVGVIARSVGLNGAHWRSVGVSETQWGPRRGGLELGVGQWGSVGVSGAQ